jgi:large subunit ribosomal protein L25
MFKNIYFGKNFLRSIENFKRSVAMEDTLHGNIRLNPSKGNNNRLRKAERVPGVLYGLNNPNFNVEFAEMELIDVLQKVGEHGVVDIDINNSHEKAMIKEVQRDPLTRKITHIDLQRVDDAHKIHAKVPIVIRGEDRLKSMGAMVQKQLNEVDVVCTADKLPKYIVADLSRFDIGDRFMVRDLEVADEISVINDSDIVIAAITHIKENKTELQTPNAASVMHVDD